MTTFWSIALSLMKEKKIKQTDLMEVTGQSRSGVSAWITRDLIPRADHALAIADRLGVSVRYLITGKDDAMPAASVRRLLELVDGMSDAEVSWLCDQVVNYRILENRKRGEVSPASGTAAG